MVEFAYFPIFSVYSQKKNFTPPFCHANFFQKAFIITLALHSDECRSVDCRYAEWSGAVLSI